MLFDHLSLAMLYHILGKCVVLLLMFSHIERLVRLFLPQCSKSIIRIADGIAGVHHEVEI